MEICEGSIVVLISGQQGQSSIDIPTILTRDKIMSKMREVFNVYAFFDNSGYPLKITFFSKMGGEIIDYKF